MKTLLYPEFDKVELAEAPIPTPGAGEVLLRVAAVGICGSELEAFRNRSPRRPPPLVMGHEFCGTVEALGDGVGKAELGRRVVSNSLVPCGECVRCKRGDTHLCGTRQIFGMHRPGAFAEYVAVPARCLIPWPDDLSAEAACLAEPLANGVHMVNLTRHLRPRTVLVIGAGPIGLMAQQAFQAMLGARVTVADLSADRTQVALRHGAERVFNPRESDALTVARELTDGEGFDLAVDAVGAQATKRQSVAVVRPSGAAVWIGLHENEISLPSYEVTLPERHIFGSYASSMDEMATAVDLMATGQVKTDDWARIFPMDRAVEAFDRMLAAQGTDIKGVILPGA